MIQSFNYAFTITLVRRLYDLKPEEQYDLVVADLMYDIVDISTKRTVILECTKSFNIHFHGVMKIPITDHVRCVKKFYDKWRKHRFVGYTNIKQMEDYGWIEYIKKDIAKTHRAIDRRPILWDDFNYFTTDEIANHGCQWPQAIE